ncbi:hypothetical protein MALH07_00178 [Mycoplasma anatis]|uniref:aromatic motif membrane protein n=1 Tax=Mycoplasmopsis anatis TaxID=171279 RepID=UPI001C4F8B9E|nr:aromatic motif membrane protein [Mycoplasmopsis anatis]MBW0598807.1 hypothetical protein [Mycoplasmopsis anatis]MBW0600832.1 hypothetical protein [Mycoplasmopsis anatis]
MKKLLKNKFIFLSSISFFTLSISCTSNSENINKNLEQKTESKFISENKFAKELINSQFPDETQKKDFIYNQSKIIANKKQELKSALVWFSPLRVSLVNSQSDYKNLIETSKKILENNINKNWLWILDNIKSFEFVFNPYGSKFDDQGTDYFKNVLENVEQFNPSLKISINNNQIQDVLTINVNNDKEDLFQNKQIHFLIYDNNKAIKVVTYTQNNQNYLKLIPDLFYSPFSKSVDNFKNNLLNLEKVNIKSKELLINKDIEYNQNFYDNYNHLNSYKTFNDFNEFKTFSSIYADINEATMKTILTDQSIENEDKIFRYTWRNIND